MGILKQQCHFPHVSKATSTEAKDLFLDVLKLYKTTTNNS